MGTLRVMITVVRIVHKVITLIPKLNRETKHIKDPFEKSKVQQSLIEKELRQIPGYQEMIKLDKTRNERKKQEAQKRKLGQKALAQTLRSLSQTQKPYKRNQTKANQPKAQEIPWQNKQRTQPKQKIHKNSQTAAYTGYEDYPLLHELLAP